MGEEVVLDGSASQGPIAQFSWQQLAGPAVALAGANTSLATFAAPLVEQPTLYTFELTVEDSQGNTATDAVDVIVSPVAAKACGQKNETSADVVFVVDRSGSMSSSTGTGETRLDAVKRTAPLLLNQFGPTVRSAVVSFNSSAVLNKALTNDHDATLAAVNALFPSGGTDASDGFQRALDALSTAAEPAQSQAIVFLTDGDSNASAIAQSARDSGVTVYAIGYFLDQNGEARIRDQVSQPAEEFYFSANDEQTLETAFSAIGRALRPRFVAFSSGSVLRVESGFSGAQPIIDNVFLIDDNDPNAQESDGGGGSLGMQPISLPLGFLTVDLGLAEASAGGQFDDARTQGAVTGRSALASVAIDFGGLARLEIGAIDARSTTSLITDAGLVPQADELGTTARLMLPGFEAPMPLIENQPLDLGFVELVVGERVEEKSADRASLTVNGVRLRVGGEEGGELVIGQAVSSIDCSPVSPASSP